MPINEAFILINTAITGINTAITGIKAVSTGIEEVRAACQAAKVAWFQPVKKLDDIEQKITSSEEKVKTLEEAVNSLQGTVNSLKQKVNTELPALKQLILSYSEVRKDAAVAGAIANKAGEIIKLAPSVAGLYVVALASTTRTAHTQINININALPALDVAVLGEINEKLRRVEYRIRDLEKITVQGGSQGVDTNTLEVANIFQEISENYAGVEHKLAELLNKKILKDLDPPLETYS